MRHEPKTELKARQTSRRGLSGRRSLSAEYFCATMREVAETCGIDTALNLVYYFKGCRIYIPKQPGNEGRLNLIGRDAAARLCAVFGGTEMSVPRQIYSGEGLDILVREADAAGMRQMDIALGFDISQRLVRQILQGKRRRCPNGRRNYGGGRSLFADSRQMDLEEYLREH